MNENAINALKSNLSEWLFFFIIDEKQLAQENLSDMIAHKILEEGADINILDIASRKVEHLKSTYITGVVDISRNRKK